MLFISLFPVFAANSGKLIIKRQRYCFFCIYANNKRFFYQMRGFFLKSLTNHGFSTGLYYTFPMFSPFSFHFSVFTFITCANCDFCENIAWVFWVNRVFGVFLIYPKYYLFFFFSIQTTKPYNRFFFYRLCGFSLSPNNLITSIPRTFREHILRQSQMSAEIHSKILSP